MSHEGGGNMYLDICIINIGIKPNKLTKRDLKHFIIPQPSHPFS